MRQHDGDTKDGYCLKFELIPTDALSRPQSEGLLVGRSSNEFGALGIAVARKKAPRW